MTQVARHEGAGLDRLLRMLFWGAAGVLLLGPAVAMRFTEVNWGGEDFLLAGMLLGAVGVAFEAVMRRRRSWAYRFGAGFAIGAAFLILWANAAVGMIGDGPNLYNLLFLAVIGLALVGALVDRFRAGGLALVMLVAGIVHLCVALAGMAVDLRGGLFSAVLGGLWLLSAACFRRAAGEKR